MFIFQKRCFNYKVGLKFWRNSVHNLFDRRIVYPCFALNLVKVGYGIGMGNPIILAVPSNFR